MQYTKRSGSRVKCGYPGALLLEGRELPGTLRDLSRGGCFFVTGELLPVGTKVRLRIELPGIEPLEVSGDVRYQNRQADGTGMGIMFSEASAEARDFIAHFVHARVDSP